MPGDAVSLIAPDLLLAELNSLIAKRVRRRLMQSNEASKAFQLMKVSAPVLFSTIALLEGAFELAIATQNVRLGFRLPRACHRD
jgi:hypothetical protein